MRIGLKLSLLLALASVIPLAVASFHTVPLVERSTREKFAEMSQSAADALADSTFRFIDDRVKSLAVAVQAAPYSAFDPADEEYAALIRAKTLLLYQQTRNADVVGVFDADGLPQGEIVHRPVQELDGNETVHEAILSSDLEVFATHVPFKETLARGAAVIGPPFLLRDSNGTWIPRVVVGIPTEGATGEPWVVAVQLSLRPLFNRFVLYRVGETGQAMLVDQSVRLVAHRDQEYLRTMPDMRSHPLLGKRDSGALIGAVADVPQFGWRVMVVQLASEALATIEAQRRELLTWSLVGLLSAFVLGFSTSQMVTRPLSRLRDAAVKVAKGAVDVEVTVRGKDEIAQLSEAFNTMTRGLKERERLKATFSRYVSGEIAARILHEKSDTDLQGELVEVTVLFLDVRGFTTLSERIPPDQVVELLNAYFEKIVHVVGMQHGVINKFIGDAVMVIFGMPRELPNPEFRAVQAALQLQKLFADFSEERRRKGLETAQFGIGINTGPAIAGNLGSRERMEYTVIGDAVNLAQRLQAQAKPGEVIVSTSTYARVLGQFLVEPRGVVQVKGKAKPVEVFAVIDRVNVAESA